MSTRASRVLGKLAKIYRGLAQSMNVKGQPTRSTQQATSQQHKSSLTRSVTQSLCFHCSRKSGTMIRDSSSSINQIPRSRSLAGYQIAGNQRAAARAFADQHSCPVSPSPTPLDLHSRSDQHRRAWILGRIRWWSSGGWPHRTLLQQENDAGSGQVSFLLISIIFNSF